MNYYTLTVFLFLIVIIFILINSFQESNIETFSWWHKLTHPKETIKNIGHSITHPQQIINKIENKIEKPLKSAVKKVGQGLANPKQALKHIEKDVKGAVGKVKDLTHNDTFKKFGNSIIHPNNTIKKIGEGAKKFGNTITHPNNTIKKIGEGVKKFGNSITHPGNTLNKIEKGIENVGSKMIGKAKSLPLPKIPTTNLDLKSKANELISDMKGKFKHRSHLPSSVQSVITCKGAHLYEEESTCPAIRPYKWSEHKNSRGGIAGVCCNSFPI